MIRAYSAMGVEVLTIHVSIVNTCKVLYIHVKYRTYM